MNSYICEVRRRNQTLLIVEGNHEKNELFWLILRAFPEINIDMDNIWIYRTNIYLLYEDIAAEYDADWGTEEIDIDLPFVISKKQMPNDIRYKADFTNIILVFDYERHDMNFSESKILEMQNRFSDAADMGKLYINYPMVESYQHLKSIPDSEFAERKIPVSLQPGRRYKQMVGRESVIEGIIEFPHRIDDLMKEHFGITNVQTRQRCCEKILNFSETENIEGKLQEVLQNLLTERRQKTLKYQLKDWVNRIGYAKNGQTYWQYVRKLFIEIIYHNICKANRIQNNIYEIDSKQYQECFERLDLGTILKKQNSFSDTEAGFIWVLNTSVFMVADYNFSLVQRDNQTYAN